jgi:hypothetical protein
MQGSEELKSLTAPGASRSAERARADGIACPLLRPLHGSCSRFESSENRSRQVGLLCRRWHASEFSTYGKVTTYQFSAASADARGSAFTGATGVDASMVCSAFSRSRVVAVVAVVEIVKRTIDMTSELQGMDVCPQPSSRGNEHHKKNS